MRHINEIQFRISKKAIKAEHSVWKSRENVSFSNFASEASNVNKMVKNTLKNAKMVNLESFW